MKKNASIKSIFRALPAFFCCFSGIFSYFSGIFVVVSSASVERLFSILASQIHDSQSRALSDYQIAAVLLRYNTNSRS